MVVKISSRKDLIDLMNDGQLVPLIGVATIILALGGTFIDAYDFGSIGIGVVQLETLLHLTSTQVGFLTAAMAFGADTLGFIMTELPTAKEGTIF